MMMMGWQIGKQTRDKRHETTICGGLEKLLLSRSKSLKGDRLQGTTGQFCRHERPTSKRDVAFCPKKKRKQGSLAIPSACESFIERDG